MYLAKNTETYIFLRIIKKQISVKKVRVLISIRHDVYTIIIINNYHFKVYSLIT